mmetsp:Transcript_56841/g.122935  ORF Transcript_56841/g.122935 Transcript_56841/m.122935 type:complete len:294 (-) Transcript_56841:96-977(-)
MSFATSIAVALKPALRWLVTLAPQLFYAKRAVEKATGWSIFDPAEPLLALGFVICLCSWFLSWVGMMEFRGYLTTIMLGVACSRIHVLGSLKEKLDRFAAENEKFRATNRDLKSSVNQLNQQNSQLEAANKKLQTSIEGLDQVREAMEKYAEKSNSDLGHVLTSLQDSIAEQKRIQQQTEKIQAQTRKLTIEQERSMLMNLFMQFQNQDGEKGLNRDEFDTLIDMLPEGSCATLRNGVSEFKSVDLDGDGTISIKNFRDWIRKVANDYSDGGNSGSSGIAMTTLPSGTSAVRR